MTRDISVSEIKDSYPAEKPLSLWARFVTVPLSFIVAWICLKIGMGANQVTYLSIIFVIFGGGLMAIGEFKTMLLGAVLFNLYLLLDGVDGNIARVTKDNSVYGQWIDNLGGYIAYPFIFLSLGITVERMAISGPVGDLDYILIGAIAAIANLLTRNQFQKFKMIKPQKGSAEVPNESRSLLGVINQNVGIIGFLTPLILISVVISAIHWLLIFYAFFYFSGWVVLTLLLIVRVERAERQLNG